MAVVAFSSVDVGPVMLPDSLASVTVTSTSRVDMRSLSEADRHLVDVVCVGVVRGFVVCDDLNVVPRPR